MTEYGNAFKENSPSLLKIIFVKDAFRPTSFLKVKNTKKLEFILP